MTEQANPAAGAVQEDPASFEGAVSRLAQLESQGQQEQPEEQEQPTEEVATEGQAEAEADSPASEEAQAVEQPEVEQTYTIIHQGQEVPLTQAQLIEHAQQGYDYTRKSMALAEKARQAEERLQRLAAAEQVSPFVQQQRAVVKSLESQLAPFMQVDWASYLAQNGTEAFGQAQAQFLNLQRTYQQARGQLDQAEGQMQQHLQAVQQQRRMEEEQRLASFGPEWTDPAKREATKSDIVKHYTTTYGVDARELDSRADSALAVSVLHKAMLWDRLQKSKADTSKTLRTKPPVSVPGAKTATAKVEKVKAAEQKLKRSGSMDDAVEVLLNRR